MCRSGKGQVPLDEMQNYATYKGLGGSLRVAPPLAEHSHPFISYVTYHAYSLFGRKKNLGVGIRNQF
jgi:hypothetical protein